jgi:hypothetical protein
MQATDNKGKERKLKDFDETDDIYISVESYGDPAVVFTKAEIEYPSIAGVVLNFLFYVLTCLILIPFSFFTVEPQQHVLVIFWGSLVKVVKKPGLYWYLMFGRSVKTIPTCVQTLDIKKSTVVDRNGNPIVVAGVVTFQIIDSVKAAFGA